MKYFRYVFLLGMVLLIVYQAQTPLDSAQSPTTLPHEVPEEMQKTTVMLPLKKESPAALNYFEGLQPLTEHVIPLRKLSDEELNERIKRVKDEISQNLFVERANKNELSDTERRGFAQLMHEESALGLVLLERKLEEAERLL